MCFLYGDGLESGKHGKELLGETVVVLYQGGEEMENRCKMFEVGFIMHNCSLNMLLATDTN